MAAACACGRWQAKHYILAAFTAGFIAAAVVTIVFVVLSPARIRFFVTSASSHEFDGGGGGGVELSLTISANNTSRRAGVRFRSMYVDVSNGTGPDWVRASYLSIPGPALYLGARLPRSEIINMTAKVIMNVTQLTRRHALFSVRVTAVARFYVGVAWTRLYDIKVVCAPVDFFGNKSTAAIIVPCA